MLPILQVILALSLLPRLGFAAASTNRACYYLNGDVASDHDPCKSGDNVVNCCDTRAVCVSNGISCMETWYSVLDVVPATTQAGARQTMPHVVRMNLLGTPTF